MSKLTCVAACLAFSLGLLFFGACEDKPLPKPPPDFGKMEDFKPSGKAAERLAKKKAEEQQVVMDGAVRLRWKLAEGEKARAFRIRTRPTTRGNRRFRFDPKRQTNFGAKARRFFESRNGPAQKGELIGVLRRKDATYGSLALDYFLKSSAFRELGKNRKMQSMIREILSKPIVSAEIAKNGQVIDVKSPYEATSISAGGCRDSGVALESGSFTDLTFHTIMLEMPTQRVAVGDTWSFQLRHPTQMLMEMDKPNEKVVVKLTSLEEKDERVLAHLDYNIRVKNKGRWMKIGRKPIPQTFGIRFAGEGVFDATNGSWVSLKGTFQRSGRGVLDFASSEKISIKALKEIPSFLQGILP